MVALQKAVDGNNSGNMKGYYPERLIPISGASRPNPGVSNLTIFIKLIISMFNFTKLTKNHVL
jgi:hypothetical protein